MNDIPDDRKYGFPTYWKLLKISKKYFDIPREDHFENLYHQFNFSQIVYSIKGVIERVHRDKYSIENFEGDMDRLFNYDKKTKNGTATSKIFYMSEKLRHSKDTRDSVHTSVLVETRLGIGVNENTGSSKTNKNKNNKTNNEDTIFSYVSSIRNKDVKVTKETFDECFEEIKKFAEKYFDSD